MPTWIWIVIAVVVVLAIALGTGAVLARRRRISLKDAAPPPKTGHRGPAAEGRVQGRRFDLVLLRWRRVGYRDGAAATRRTATAPPVADRTPP